MKAKVIFQFYGLEENKNFKVDDIIEISPSRFEKLKQLGLVQSLEVAEERETKVLQPEERKKGRPRKEV
jgi:hypothetical protein